MVETQPTKLEVLQARRVLLVDTQIKQLAALDAQIAKETQ